MKKFLEKILIILAKNDLLWIFLKPISSAGNIFEQARLNDKKEKNDSEAKFDYLFESLTVLNGPFKGLIYPSLDAVGSVIYPKLLGSYESELHHALYTILDDDYSEIIDVGCAEGYYAVGMARKYIDAEVFAYDTNEKAQKLCSAMAFLNGVSNRVEVNSECTSEQLGSFKFTKKGLIICDCEGCESKLFNSQNIDNLKQCDLLIELHDFVDIEISGSLKILFSKTHDIESIYSVDDIQKAQSYNYGELSDLSLNDKKKILREGRPAIMEWIVCKAKKSNLHSHT